MAARTNTLQLRESWREKIKTSMLINRLTKHALSKSEEMTASQIKAAEILLRKTFPDLTVNELTAPGGGSLFASQLSDEELADIASGRSARAAGAKKRP